jgi:Fe2+ or Zn2+ uptake regulation protein
VRPVEAIIADVRARGGKVTAQRVLVCEALAGDRSHPTAEQLHARLRARLPHLSLTTVYATLSDLVACGDIQRLQTGDGQVHFDPETEPHAHLVCVRCQRIHDAPPPLGREPLPSGVAGFAISGRTELLLGLCPECAAALSAEAGGRPTDQPRT